MNDVLHINFRAERADWILRLQSMLNKSPAVELRLRAQRSASSCLGEKAGAIATRMMIVEVALNRLENDLAALGEDMRQNPNLPEYIEQGWAYDPKRRQLAYELLTDFDSFLFETRSAYEIIVNFLASFFCNILRRVIPQTRTALNDWVAQNVSPRGGDMSWVDELRRNRNLFAHATAPWPALEIVCKDPLRVNLVLLKENVANLSQPNTYLHADQCIKIHSGFVAIFPILERWLTEEIRHFEAGQPLSQARTTDCP
jgi:hypothetical protein